eukprot:m.13381 g.13381  ORF g.13381 m.13381 type:complete len:309 (+) comp2820_c0_seq1:40-966(+)
MEAKGYVFMLLLALQFGLQPILVREFTPNETFKASVVIACEVVKFFACLLMLLIDNKLGEALSAWRVQDSLAMAGLPALIYSVQNVLAQVAYQNLDGLTFNVINQTKTLFSAVCLYYVMGQRQSFLQCIALGALFGASLLLSTQESTTTRANSFEKGIIPVFAASLLSGLAQALSQKSLQGAGRNSYFYTMELAVFSTLLLAVSLPFQPDWPAMRELGLLHAFTPLTAFPIVVNGLGGIIVGLVTKYAGGDRKGFAILAGIVLTGVFEWLLYGQGLTPQLLVVAPVVVVATYVHITFPYVSAEKPKTS